MPELKTKVKEKKIFEHSLFPSRELIKEISSLPTVYTATFLNKLNVEEILRLDWTGRVATLPASISILEASKIKEAAVRSKERIKIIETDPAAEKDLMRRIDEDFLNSKNRKKIFIEYLETIRGKGLQLETEFTEHTLKHNAKEDNILNFHYLTNLGLDLVKQDVDGKSDELRFRMLNFIETILKENEGIFDGVINTNYGIETAVKDHKELKKAFLFGLLSNFLRGGFYYGFRKNPDLNYEFRRDAFELISEEVKKRNKLKK